MTRRRAKEATSALVDAAAQGDRGAADTLRRRVAAADREAREAVGAPPRRRKPPAPRRGPRPGPTRRRFVVDGVDLGDGVGRTCWLVVDDDVASVRVWHGRGKGWTLPLAEVAAAVARRGQVLEAEARLGVHRK